MRVVIGSDRAANALMDQHGATYNFGSTSRAYVVALDGHFVCEPPACAQGSGFSFPTSATTTSTAASAVPVSTMVPTVDPKSLAVTGLRVIDHKVDLTTLGREYSLGR
jgi:hypothetical protein